MDNQLWKLNSKILVPKRTQGIKADVKVNGWYYGYKLTRFGVIYKESYISNKIMKARTEMGRYNRKNEF